MLSNKGKTLSLNTSCPQASGARTNGVRNLPGAEGRGGTPRETQAYLSDDVEGRKRTTGHVNIQEGAGDTAWNGRSRPVRKLHPWRPAPLGRLQSNGPLVIALPGETGPPSSASPPCSEFDFELCGLCGGRGSGGLEERLQDGVRVHFRCGAGGGSVHPAGQLRVPFH